MAQRGEGPTTSSHLANFEIFSAIAVLGLSLLLAVVSFLTFRRLHSRRVFFIGLGFLVFALQGAYLVNRSYALRGSEPWLLPVALMDIGVLGFLYLALRIQ